MRVVEKTPCFVTSCLKKSGSASVLVIRIYFWSAVSIHGSYLKQKQHYKQADTLYTTGKQWRQSVTPTTDISSSGVVRTPTKKSFSPAIVVLVSGKLFRELFNSTCIC